MNQKISFSKAKVWRRCHAAYHYRYVLKLRKKTKARPLILGSLVHECLERKAAGKPYDDILLKYDKDIKKLFAEERAEMDLDSVVPNTKRILVGYDQAHRDDGFKYLAIEKEVLVPIIDGVDFEGKIDGIVQKKDGRVFILERKTCKSIPEEGVRLSDIQSVLYFWATPKSGYRRKIDGIIWDYVRSKPPTIPDLLKKGGLSKAKIDTLPEVYLEAVHKHGLDPADYKEMLDSLELKRDSFFRRIQLPFSAVMRDNVIHDMRQTASQIAEFGADWKDRNLTRDCGWCEYNTLCQAELRGSDTDFILKREYEVSKRDQKEDNRESNE